MEVMDSFIPTAGSVGLLPIVTYFFMVVAMLAFAALTLTAHAYNRFGPSEQQANPKRLVLALLATASFVSALTYYLLQSNYHALLAEIPAVSDITDQQTLMRESYNAIGQQRYIAWFINTPIFLILTISPLRLPWATNKRLLISLFAASLFMVFTGYIGHQQLSFDNEIQPGPKAVWGLISALGCGYIARSLYRLYKESDQQQGRAMATLFVAGWVIYFLGYLATFLPIDFNWIHIVYTLTDLSTLLGIGLFAYSGWSKPLT